MWAFLVFPFFVSEAQDPQRLPWTADRDWALPQHKDWMLHAAHCGSCDCSTWVLLCTQSSEATPDHLQDTPGGRTLCTVQWELQQFVGTSHWNRLEYFYGPGRSFHFLHSKQRRRTSLLPSAGSGRTGHAVRGCSLQQASLFHWCRTHGHKENQPIRYWRLSCYHQIIRRLIRY